MDGIVNRLMDLHGGQLLVPLVLCVLLVLIFKGLSGMNHSRGSARKEFLELFHDAEKKDDLWLSVAVRHHFGAYLPVSIIRRLSKLDQPARAIMEVADAWPLIDLDDATGELRWRKPRHASPTTRRLLSRAFLLGYFALGLSAAILGYILVVSQIGGRITFAYWLWVVIGGTAALWCLHRSELIKDGGTALERWLGMGKCSSRDEP
ncbi:TPA: hypothetical protein UMX25_001300 [Stenotrophomonas maltophilia]|uniref:hypothetical protein n=1 Tax=Stenotrophomonas maltophilia TaxID=40324 RepID=UPI002A9E9A67|nr:hypothetical protein [Stenotrophomonas maltophilia]HEL4226773.1 hypothetical protein [Stenotrophomonas maltophilia]